MILEREEGINYGVKGLKLISPNKAAEFGIVTEAPVFSSRGAHKQSLCADCGVEYAPLVYGEGIVVESHHYHGYDNGGIYSYPVSEAEEFAYPWTAEIKKLGSQTPINSVAAEVIRISAFCSYHFESPEQLQEGFVVGEDELFPVCQLSEDESAKFRFIVREGKILFSQL